MTSILAVAWVVGATVVLAVMISRSFGQQASLLLGALAFQIVAAIVHVAIVREYYGYGDMLAYWRSGLQLARSVDVGQISLGDILALVFQMESQLNVIGNGRSTGTMHGIAGLLSLFLGDSLYLACISIALAGFTGRLCLFSVLARVWPRAMGRLVVAIFLVPSTAFWSAGLLKEAIAIPGLVVAAAVAVQVLAIREGSLGTVAMGVFGCMVVGLTKPYLLFPLLLSVLAGSMVRYASAFRVVPVAVVVMAGLAALGALFPRYALDSVADSAEELRTLGSSHAGGSTFNVPQSGLLLLVPLGAATALFRPLLFEAVNPLLLLSALEMTVFGWLVVGAVRRASETWRAVRASWVLAASVTFVVVFSVALGISTTNLGTLARYRAPMMPFYGIALVGASMVAPPRRRPLLRAPTARSYPLAGGGAL